MASRYEQPSLLYQLNLHDRVLMRIASRTQTSTNETRAPPPPSSIPTAATDPPALPAAHPPQMLLLQPMQTHTPVL